MSMKIRISSLRHIIREELTRLKKDLDEVDLDPSNNPGRPDDAYEYLGMHPSPEMAMAHPAAGGGSTSLAGPTGEGGDETTGEDLGGTEPIE